MTPAGFPHSEIHGSQFAFNFPWLIVDRYVLHRLPMPRHPPCALLSLTLSSFLTTCRAPIMLESLLGSYNLQNYSYYPNFTSLYLNFVSFFIQFSRYRSLLAELVGSNGLEPSTSRLSGVRSNHLSYEPMCLFGPFALPGGDEQNRTVDPLLARQVLSQLSYTPV